MKTTSSRTKSRPVVDAALRTTWLLLLLLGFILETHAGWNEQELMVSFYVLSADDRSSRSSVSAVVPASTCKNVWGLDRARSSSSTDNKRESNHVILLTCRGSELQVVDSTATRRQLRDVASDVASAQLD